MIRLPTLFACAWCLVVLCGAADTQAQPTTPTPLVITDAQGAALANAVASVPGAQLAAGSADSTRQYPEATMDQQDLQFHPQVLVIAPGTMVHFPNSDDTHHHVYSFSDTKSFELPLYHANDAPPIEFETAGLVKLGCNIHDRMRGYIVVSDTPVIAVSDARGMLTLPAFVLPEKTSATSDVKQFDIWHPQMDEPIHLPLTDLAQGDDRAQDQGQAQTIQLPFVLETETEEDRKESLKQKLKRYRRGGA